MNNEDKRLTPEQAGQAVEPERSAQTVRRWCKEENLPHSKDGKNGTILISRYALKKWAKSKGIMMKGGGF